MIYKRGGHWRLDVTMHGVRYREALDTTDKRAAKELEKKRIAEINQGKGASKTGRAFARKPFSEAAMAYLEERKPHVSEGTMRFERERLGPLLKHFRREVAPALQSGRYLGLPERAIECRYIR